MELQLYQGSRVSPHDRYPRVHSRQLRLVLNYSLITQREKYEMEHK